MTRHFMGKVSMVIIMDWSLDRPPNFDVIYWLTPATMVAQPMFRERMVSSAVPVFLRRKMDEARRLYRASSNMLAVLSFKIELLRDVVYNKDTVDFSMRH